jgi:mono/diheme cytochrome c family protein
MTKVMQRSEVYHILTPAFSDTFEPEIIKTTRMKFTQKHSSMNSIRIAMMVTALFFSAGVFTGCSSGNENANKDASSENNLMKEAETAKDDGLGIGPVKHVDIPAAIDAKMADAGKSLFEAKCTACHKWQKEKYVGPGLMGVTQRRKPEWIMNQILNPDGMTKSDPTAKELLATYLTQMTNQNVTEQDARSIYEYFRKMDKEGATASSK